MGDFPCVKAAPEIDAAFTYRFGEGEELSAENRNALSKAGGSYTAVALNKGKAGIFGRRPVLRPYGPRVVLPSLEQDHDSKMICKKEVFFCNLCYTEKNKTTIRQGEMLWPVIRDLQY